MSIQINAEAKKQLEILIGEKDLTEFEIGMPVEVTARLRGVTDGEVINVGENTTVTCIHCPFSTHGQMMYFAKVSFLFQDLA